MRILKLETELRFFGLILKYLQWLTAEAGSWALILVSHICSRFSITWVIAILP